MADKNPIWKCNECGHIEHKEKEISCLKCGKGKMIYKGKE